MATKCIVNGCLNRIGEGSFVGKICAPCDSMLRTSVVGVVLMGALCATIHSQMIRSSTCCSAHLLRVGLCV